tara:strand:+ start:69 stop:791 length:723 start_codon:yes stop_codon:yes gene_type:complete
MVATAGQFMGGTAGPYADPTEASPELFQGLVNFLAAGGKFEDYLARTFPQTAFADKKMTKDAAQKLLEGMSSTQKKAFLPKAASKVAGMGTRRLPLLAGGLQALSGDPIGGVGTAGGGFAGAALGAKIGSVGGVPGVVAGGLIGGMLGSSVGQGITRGIAGIDINDPYSGPDISLPIFGGIPITPAAKTKKSRQRMREERMKDVEAMAPYMRQQFAMDMASQQQAISGQLMGNIISNSRR